MLATAIGLCFAHTLPAQQHYNSWFRATISYPVNAKIKTDVAFQHRRQNGFGNENVLNKNLMFTFRNWVHYQYNGELRLSVSPFAYFTHYRIIQSPTDLTTQPFHEVRFSAAIDWQHMVLDNFYFINRTAVEYRIFQNIQQRDIVRTRNRFGFRQMLTKELKCTVFDEVFMNVAGAKIPHFFDHNRIGGSVEYGLLPNLKTEIGYTRIKRLPMTSNTLLYENNIFLNITYLFHRK